MNPEDVPAAIEELRPFFLQITEAQLKDYGESANAGCWVSFRLPDPESLECYRGRDRSGRNARSGQRYTLMVVELDEHTDEPVNNERRTRMENPEKEVKPMSLPQMSGYFCTLPDFREWLLETYDQACEDTEAAAAFVRGMCNIESRRDLLTNEAAATIFRKMAAEFDEWRKTHANDAQG